MPIVETKKPTTQNAPATTIDFRGPTRSTHVPPIADEMPSIAMASEKIQPIATSPPSPIPKCSASGILKTENAYAWPMLRWIASAAGGMSHRLKVVGAMIASRSRTDI